jgi:hypothetical protein
MSIVISSTTDDQNAVNAAAGITTTEEPATEEQQPEAATPPWKKPEPPEEPDEDEDGDEEETEEEGEPAKQPVKKLGGWQRKIAKLEEANTYAFRRLAQLEDQAKAKQEPPAGPPKEPTLEDYPDNYDAYIKASVKWQAGEMLRERDQENLQKAREWQKQEAERSTVETWQTRVNDFRTKTKDFDAVLDTAEDIELHPAIRQSLLSYEHGPRLAYELARNRTQLEKIAGLSNPLDALRELGRFEATLAGPPARAKAEEAPKAETRIETRKPFTAPPEPIRPVGKGSNGNVRIPLGDMSYQDYKHARERDIKARRAR